MGLARIKDLTITVRSGFTDATRGAPLAAELMSAAPDVVLAVSPISVAALRPIAGTTPIVFVRVSDPVGLDFVASFAHPGGNITGFTSVEPSISGKWLQLLKQIAPGVMQVGQLIDPGNPSTPVFLSALKDAAPSVGVTLVELPVRDDPSIDRAIAEFAAKPGRGLLIVPSPFSIAHVETIITAVQRAALPAMYWDQSFVPLGGLASYGVDAPDNFRSAAGYIDRILKGAKPADLPVQNPTKFDFVINLKTAKGLGLTWPQSLLSTADQVIE